ncbi:GNAT family N-acetyltransferase [Phocaeicola sp.]
MILKTERLILRPWRATDAADLYRYAKDERVGPVAGWPPHKSVGESAEVIRTVFAQEGVYAVALKEDDVAIGCIGLITGDRSNFPISESEGEISYWIGVPFWGQGLIPEAMREVIRYGFEDLKLTTLWCGYFDGNEKSKRAQEKCGFRHYRTEKEKPYALMGDVRTEHISRLTKEEWAALVCHSATDHNSHFSRRCCIY